MENGRVTDAAVAPTATRREWIGLAVLALPCLLYSMDLTGLNLAVPHLSTQAFAVCLFHWEGTSGRTLDFRLATGLRRQDDEWVIVHEHHSVRTIEERFTGAATRQE